MNYAEQISIPLRREIYNGSRYAKFLPKSTCQTSNLGNGENTIAEGVNFMAQHVKEWAHQTEKLTKALGLHKILQEKGIPATVAVVYGFLYAHIQYSADWQTQNLRSPACSWYARKQGIDCKSYSIFAACILENLGLNYSIRRVKQPGSHPDLWSHVYVTVPLDQTSNPQQQLDEKKYLVIDATKHENSEVAYLEKHDTIMSQKHKYVAMNAATGTVATASIPAKYRNELTSFLHALMNKHGYSLQMATQIVNHISGLLNDKIAFENIIIAPISRNSKKGWYVGTLSPNTGVFYEKSRLGLGNVLDDLGVDGEEIFNDVKDSSWFKNTFGSFLGNIGSFITSGMWCDGWYSPDKAQSDAKKDFPYLLEISGLINGVSQTSLDSFLQHYEIYIHEVQVAYDKDFNKCTHEGIKVLRELLRDFKTEVLGRIEAAGYKLTPQPTKKTSFRRYELPGWKDARAHTVVDYTPMTLSKETSSQPSSGNGNVFDNISDNIFKNVGSVSKGDSKLSVSDSIATPSINKKTSTGTKVMTAGAGAALLLFVGPKLLEAFKNTKKSSK